MLAGCGGLVLQRLPAADGSRPPEARPGRARRACSPTGSGHGRAITSTASARPGPRSPRLAATSLGAADALRHRGGPVGAVRRRARAGVCVARPGSLPGGARAPDRGRARPRARSRDLRAARRGSGPRGDRGAPRRALRSAEPTAGRRSTGLSLGSRRTRSRRSSLHRAGNRSLDAMLRAPSPLAPRCHTGDTGRSGGGREPWSAGSRSARSCPSGEALAAAVAAELHEPIATVRPAVLVGSVTLDAAFASEDDLAAAIEAERARVRDARGPIRPARLIDVPYARRAPRGGRPDRQRRPARPRRPWSPSSGPSAPSPRASRSGWSSSSPATARPGASSGSRAVDATRDGRLTADDLGNLGRLILLWNELTSLVVTDGFRNAEREMLARDADARRAALEELLGVIAADPVTAARLRRAASRFGLDPERSYRLAAIAIHPEADPTPEQPGIDEADIEDIARRIGHLAGRRRREPRGRAPGSACRPSSRCAAGSRSSPATTGPASPGLPGYLDVRCSPPPAGSWVAVGSPVLEGVTSLAAALRRPPRRHAHRARDRDPWLARGPGRARRRAAPARRAGSSATPRWPGSSARCCRRAPGHRARGDAPGLLRRRREHARDRPPAPPREPHGGLPAREDRGAPRRAAGRRAPPPPRRRADGGPPPVRLVMIGRDAELANLAAVIEADGTVVVVGEAGIGKTTLVREAALAAGRTLREGGAFSTLAWMPYFALERATGLHLRGDADWVAGAVEGVVGPDVLFVDDAQWADDGTLGAVARLAGRVALVVAARPWRRARRRRDRDAPRVRGPGHGPRRRCRRRRHAPGDRAAPRAVRRAGRRDRAPRGWQPVRDRGARRDRRARGGPPARDRRPRRRGRHRGRATLEVLAVAQRPMPPDALDGVPELVRRGLAVAGPDGDVRVRHPLLAEVVVAGIDPDEAAAIHRRIAALVTSDGERARHLAAAGDRAAAHALALRALAVAQSPGERAAHLGIAAETAAGLEANGLRIEAATVAPAGGRAGRGDGRPRRPRGPGPRDPGAGRGDPCPRPMVVRRPGRDARRDRPRARARRGAPEPGRGRPARRGGDGDRPRRRPLRGGPRGRGGGDPPGARRGRRSAAGDAAARDDPRGPGPAGLGRGARRGGRDGARPPATPTRSCPPPTTSSRATRCTGGPRTAGSIATGDARACRDAPPRRLGAPVRAPCSRTSTCTRAGCTPPSADPRSCSRARWTRSPRSRWA